MPMGIVSDKDFDLEKSKLDPTREAETIPNSPTATIVDVTRGRPVGSKEVPNSLRQIIGEESATNGRASALEMAKLLGISDSSVSAYNNGATSTASYDQTPNENFINKSKERVMKRARSKLMSALHHMTSDKLSGAKAIDLSTIARNMSAVVKNMEPEGPKAPVNNGPTFVFYSPQMRREETFDVVVAKD